MKHFTEDAMLKVLRGQKAGGLTLRQLSERLGFSYQYLSDVLRGNKPVTVKLADALGYTRVYIRKEDHHG